jgi:hypothetical protein
VSATPTGPSVPADQPGGGPEVSAPPQVAAPPWPDRVVPTWTDPVAVQASEAVGGPWGRHAVTGRALFWTPLRVCLLFTVLVLSVAWAKQAPCADGDWSGSKQYTHLCYNDAVPLFGIHGLATGEVPYLDSAVEYPVLSGGLMQLAAVIGRGYDGLAAGGGLLPESVPVQTYYVVTCLLLSVLALVVTRGVLGLTGRRPWDAAMVGLSPVLLFYAFTNWDLLAVALTTLGMWAWARQRPVVAGVLLGLGIAAKLYPVLVLGVLFVLCLRAGRLRPWWTTAVTAGVAWLVVDLPIAVLAPQNWARFFELNGTRPANPESIWAIALHWFPGFLDGPLAEGESPTVLNATVAVLLVLCAAAAGVPAGRRVPAGEQGVQPAVRAVAAPAGGAGPAAVALAAAVAGDRGAGLDDDDAVLPRRGRPGCGRRVVLPLRRPAGRRPAAADGAGRARGLAPRHRPGAPQLARHRRPRRRLPRRRP